MVATIRRGQREKERKREREREREEEECDREGTRENATLDLCSAEFPARYEFLLQLLPSPLATVLILYDRT
jgi:hypothetical protein